MEDCRDGRQAITSAIYRNRCLLLHNEDSALRVKLNQESAMKPWRLVEKVGPLIISSQCASL